MADYLFHRIIPHFAVVGFSRGGLGASNRQFCDGVGWDSCFPYPPRVVDKGRVVIIIRHFQEELWPFGLNQMLFLETHDIFYTCPCTKEQYYRGIKSLGKKEITSIINELGQAEVTCNFCRKTYTFSKDELNQMITEIDNHE